MTMCASACLALPAAGRAPAGIGTPLRSARCKPWPHCSAPPTSRILTRCCVAATTYTGTLHAVVLMFGKNWSLKLRSTWETSEWTSVGERRSIGAEAGSARFHTARAPKNRAQSGATRCSSRRDRAVRFPCPSWTSTTSHCSEQPAARSAAAGATRRPTVRPRPDAAAGPSDCGEPRSSTSRALTRPAGFTRTRTAARCARSVRLVGPIRAASAWSGAGTPSAPGATACSRSGAAAQTTAAPTTPIAATMAASLIMCGSSRVPPRATAPRDRTHSPSG